jgi:alpha-ketoglutarate-dependent dioxygenase alkB family protein 2
MTKTTSNIENFIDYYPEYISPQTAKNFLSTADQLFKHPRSKCVVYGKTHTVPRDQVLVTLENEQSNVPRKYSYSGQYVPTSKTTKVISEIKEEVEKKINENSDNPISFNVVLINRYLNGSDSVGWHCDDETSIDQSFPIASVSFGASRDFDVREIQNKKNKKRWKLNDRDLLVMKPGTQSIFHHTIPKRKNSLKRFNLTFRRNL